MTLPKQALNSYWCKWVRVCYRNFNYYRKWSRSSVHVPAFRHWNRNVRVMLDETEATRQRDIAREVPSSSKSQPELQENVALRTTASPADTCYCKLECTGAHRSLQCGNNVLHAIWWRFWWCRLRSPSCVQELIAVAGLLLQRKLSQCLFCSAMCA
jgi:hypothetical protein